MAKYNKLKKCSGCRKIVEVKVLRFGKYNGKDRITYQCRKGHIFSK